MERPELTPAIVQDAESGRVLMLAWMDEEALRRTRESGEAWFWSRSREDLWHKGATSGNTLAVDPAGFHYFDRETGQSCLRGAVSGQTAPLVGS